MTRLYINPLRPLTDQLRSRGWLLILIVYLASILSGGNGSAYQLLAGLSLVHQLLMMCGDVGRMSSCSSCRHWDPRVVVEGEGLSLLGEGGGRGLLCLGLVAVRVELVVVHQLGVLGGGAWNRVLALWGRVVHWWGLRSHLLLAHLLCQLRLFRRMHDYRGWDPLRPPCRLKLLNRLGFPHRHLLLLLTIVIARSLWRRCRGIYYFRIGFDRAFKLFLRL